MNLTMRKICKSFGSNAVLKNIDITLSEGEICALLGENGAGKSTLMNILGGVLPADSGEITIDGKPAVFNTPADSLRMGIAFIHQELNLINDMTVCENLFIGRELKKRSGLLDTGSMIRQTRDIFKRMSFDIDLHAMLDSLDSSYKQIVEITRALMMNASVLIMDEPTTSLTEPEIERVFEMMRRLKQQGVGIIFISHKLDEVLQICDRYVVLRDGEMVADGKTDGVTTAELAYHIVGHEVNAAPQTRLNSSYQEALRLDMLSNGRDFMDVSLTLNKAEILGVTGLLGDGRSELFLAVFGEGGDYSGQVFLEGKAVRSRNSSESINRGIAYLPRNRKENGIIKDMSVMENGSVTVWRNYLKPVFLDFKRIEAVFSNQVKTLKLRYGNKKDLITSLSGGNQQKVMLGKWLAANPKVLILDNPTQGVDVGAKEEIYDIIHNLAASGMSIIVLSGEIQEIIRVCSRTIVMYHGRIQGELTGEEMTEQRIMRLATGGQADDA